MPGGCRDPRPDAGQLRIGGDADADQPTRGAGFCLLVPKLRVSCGGAGAGQGFREAGTVPDDSGRGPIRKFVGPDQVPLTQLFGHPTCFNNPTAALPPVRNP
jgi:hypothetical protein